MVDLRTVENDRLVYYHEIADNSEFWTAHWEGIDVARILGVSREGYLGDYEQVFLRHLPKHEPIPEAGCGYGRYVLALQSYGYDVTGVEFSTETVKRANRIAPDMNIQVGDILDLDYPDDTFGAYISLGVIEHFREGPQVALAEARRVLKPSGGIVCSVPYFNPYRRRKNLTQSDHTPTQDSFDQYAFSEPEIVEILQKQGFRVNHITYLGLAKGLKDEIGIVQRIQKLHPLFAKCLWHFGRTRWVLPRLMAHMITIVATKPCPDDLAPRPTQN
jgi:SAM-dependent methyltransferase